MHGGLDHLTNDVTKSGIAYGVGNGAATRDYGNLDGLRLGIGLQQGLGGRLYPKVEYRYSNYEADAERHQLLAGIGVTF